MGISQKQRRFVEEYLVDLNATQAAIRAGYCGKSGYKLMQRPEVQESIREQIRRRTERVEITQDMVLRELAAIGFAKATDHTRVSKSGVVEIMPTQEWTEAQARAVAAIKLGRYGVQVSNYDKVKALELLGKHLGMFDGRGGPAAEDENDLLERLLEESGEDMDTDDLPEIE